MPQIVAIHSFRRGTGRSHTIANVTALLAARGLRTALIDANRGLPTIAALYGLSDAPPAHSLTDFLWDRAPASAVANDVTDRVGVSGKGKIFLIAAGSAEGAEAPPLYAHHDARALREALTRLSADLQLDILLLDLPPGLGEATLLMLAVADALAVILRLDHQDYQGTAVAIEVARQLEVPRYFLVVNHAPPTFEPGYVKEQVERTYGCEVAAVIPYTDEIGALDDAGAFALRYPHHPLTAAFGRVAEHLTS